MRIAEFGQCHRDEPSGAMHGLMRTRAFEQDDAHVLCEPGQIRGEVARFAWLLREVYAALGFEDLDVALSLRPDTRAGSDADWDWSEAELMTAARDAGLEPRPLPGEGAFYGPKLEFALRDRQGRAWQCGTIQLDRVLPGRLGARYADREGGQAEPVMLHHAVLGSLGRFIGILIESCEGRLPVWLAPVQVAVLPVSDAQADAARAACDALQVAGIRAVLYGQNETLSRRLVMARDEMVPLQAIIGAREAEAGAVALKDRAGQSVMPLGEAVQLVSSVAAPPP
jgi:threonyl-tRNA synthetase